MIEIQYYTEDTNFDPAIVERNIEWLRGILHSNQIEQAEISYIFCSDQYLHDINKEYLSHDTYTDIITFDLSEENEESLVSDIFISIDRVKENAETLKEEFTSELSRVMVHGILHLLGHDDHTKQQKDKMRELETAALQKLQNT